MRILLLIPPKYYLEHAGRTMWATREYKDGYFNEPHNPYLAAEILGVLRHQMPQLELAVLDAQLEDLTHAEVVEQVRANRPDLVITLMNYACLDQDKLCAELPYPTIAVNQAYIDHREAVELYDIRASYFTQSEIEYTIADAVREFATSGKIEQTRGLLIREDNGRGEIRETGPRPLPDMAKYPFPAFDLLEIERYMELQKRHSGSQYIFLYTTHGCPFSCTFCQAGTTTYKTVRKKAPEQVLEEITYFVRRGYNHFYFYDDEFAIDMKRAKEICRQMIAQNLKIRFACYNTTNLVDEELISLMSGAGCKLIRYGLETGDMQIQKAMKTYVDEEELVNAFELTHKYGIFVDTFVLVGLPGETKRSIRQTLALLKRVKPDRVTMSILFPKPYSILYKQLKTDGLLLEPFWHKHLLSPRLTFVHDTYKSMAEIIRVERWLRMRYMRWLAWRNLFENRTGRNLYTRVIRYFHTFEPVRAAIRWLRGRPRLYRLLERGYERGNKFEL